VSKSVKKSVKNALEEGIFFWILLGTTIVGLGLSVYWSLSNEYVPVNKNTIFHNGTDLDVIVTAENYTNVPLQSFFNQKIANVTVEVYYKTLPIFLKGVKLSSNGSSILTTRNETFEPINKTRAPMNKTISDKGIQSNTSSGLQQAPILSTRPIPTPVYFMVKVKGTTAPSFQPGHRPANTLDNKSTTTWSAYGDPQSITYTFNKKYNITAVGILFNNDSVRQNFVEINGQKFTSSGKSVAFQNFTLKAPMVNTNTLKIIGHGNSKSAWNSFSEVRIYGKILATAEPVDTISHQAVGAAKYTVRLNMGHPLLAKNYSDQYAINLFYRKNYDSGNILVDKIPFTWRIKTLDWSILSYFWILFAGVLLSRVFRFTDEKGEFTGERGIKFTPLELVWVPFSAVITLLIFSSFMEQLFDRLTANILMNLALAFAFGFGFDKVLEVWQKSPALKREKQGNAGGQN